MNNEDFKNFTTNTYYELSFSDESYDDQVEAFGQAISSRLRIKIFRQLHHNPMTLVEVAKKNKITNSTALFHLKILEKANIIVSRYLPGKKGKAQVYFGKFNSLLFNRSSIVNTQQIFEQNMQVGNFIDIDCETLGIATDTTQYILSKNPYSNQRFNAQLLWSDGGLISYAFDNSFCTNTSVQELTFSLEICSEARFYRNDWKSDITFAINSVEVATFTSLGDFGGVRGKLNPNWWGNQNTQYGTLVTISVREDGSFLNNEKVSEVNLKDLNLSNGNKILFTIFTKKDAENYGGFNIFCKSFGIYEQDILLIPKYTEL